MSLVLLCVVSLVMGHVIATPHQPRCKSDPSLNCSAGQYLSCNKCLQCQPGYFSTSENRDTSCSPCHRDCRPEFNMEIVAKCTSTSDTKCRCKDGYRCDSKNSEGNCESCVAVVTMSTLVSCRPGTFFNISSGNCFPHTDCVVLGWSVITAGNSTHDAVCGVADGSDVGVLRCTLIPVFGCTVIVAVIFIFIWRFQDGSYLKQLIMIGSGDARKKEKQRSPPATVKFFAPLCNSKPQTGCDLEGHLDKLLDAQPAPPATGNLGPFHIYSPGTVFVSLLNQVTGLDKGREGEKLGQNERGHQFSPPPPPSSPPIHLSEEEREGQTDCVFFPSQEQGKETQLSKEEEM